MRDQWYGDNRDVVKWGVLLLMAELNSVVRILQVAFYRQSKWPGIEIDGKAFSLPPAIMSHFRDLHDVRRLERKVGIDVFDKLLTPDRQEYREAMASAIRAVEDLKIVFLDPDTGLEPMRDSGRLEHVQERDLEAAWAQLRTRDLLVLYQHQTNRRGEPWLEAKRIQFERAIGLPPGHAKTAGGQGIAGDVALIYGKKD